MGMPSTKNNVKAAIAIMDILAEKECTVADLQHILSYVGMRLEHTTTVPKKNYREIMKELLEACED